MPLLLPQLSRRRLKLENPSFVSHVVDIRGGGSEGTILNEQEGFFCDTIFLCIPPHSSYQRFQQRVWEYKYSCGTIDHVLCIAEAIDPVD